MSTLGWTYTPSEAVKSANGIPHVYQDGSMNSNPKFSMAVTPSAETLTGNSGYFPSLFTVPVILLALGLIALLFMNICFVLRCCCRCLKCGPTEDMIATDPLKVVKKRKFIWYWFLFWVFIVLLADHALFFGNADMDKAIDSGSSTFGLLKGLFVDIAGQTTSMSSYLADYKDAVSYSGPSCQPVLTTAADAASSGATTMNGLVSGLPNQIGNLQGYLGSDAKAYKNNIIWVLYAVIAVLVLLYPITAWFLHSKCIFYILMFVSQLVVLVYTFLCAILMFLVMFLGDFCMDPSANTVEALPAGDAANMVAYYVKCTGASPFDASITTVQTQIDQMIADMGTNSAKCTGTGAPSSWTTTYFDKSQAALTGLSAQFTSLKGSTSCGLGNNINMVWNEAMNQGICTNFFNGLFKIWVSQYVVSGALFFTVICASVLYQYFGTAWKMKATGDYNEGSPDEENPSVQSPEYELTHQDYESADFTDSHAPVHKPPPPARKA